MAKTCNVCHRTYPDHLTACPHCAKSRAEDSSVIRLHDPRETIDWEGDPSSSSDERRGDVITVDPAELRQKKKEGSSVEISLEEQQSGSSVELDRDKRSGSSLQKKSGSSMEISLDEKKDSPGSSLLLGGPDSDSGSGISSTSEVAAGTAAEESELETSAVDLGSSLEVRLDQESGEAVESDSSEVAEREETSAVAVAPPPKKGGSAMALLIGGGAGLLVASLVWIFGPLDGLRGSLRDVVGLSTGKQAQHPLSGPKQQGIQLPAAKEEDEEKAPEAKAEQEKKPTPTDDSKETKPAPAPVSPPVEKKPEVRPAPETIAEKPAPDKNLEVITQIREKLGSAGLLAQQKDPLQALDALLKEKKDNTALIAAALEKVKAGKDGNLSQAIDSLVESTKKADEKLKSLQAGREKLEKEKEEAQSALTTAATLLKQGKYVDEQSPNVAQGVEKLLADKKTSDAQVKEAGAKLKDAEETIQDMTKKLVGSKSIPQGSTPTVTTSAKISPPDITVAEKYYSAGLAHFWTGDYAAAEKDYGTAIRFYKDDARFFYYFGLCCWQEGKRTEAAEAFQKGYALELQSRPSSPVINSTFERIQGAARKALDKEREQPQVETK
jgi:tetratricopeptide (TPR) repeat protein